MSYESDECKLLIDEAIHNYFHDETETEMAVKDWFYDLLKQAAKADEYEAENKELLEELNYLKTVNNDLVWQRDTDEEHEAKAKAWDDLNNALLGKRDGFKSLLFMDENRHDAPIITNEIKNFDGILNLMNDKLSDYESGEPYAKK